MKRVGHEPQPAVIERRYNDFCFIYECILRSFHPSVLGDFQFPKKVLLGNFKAEVISERTDAFHKFLNLIANTNNLVTFSYRNLLLLLSEKLQCLPFGTLAQSKFDEPMTTLWKIWQDRQHMSSSVSPSPSVIYLFLSPMYSCLSIICSKFRITSSNFD